MSFLPLENQPPADEAEAPPPAVSAEVLRWSEAMLAPPTHSGLGMASFIIAVVCTLALGCLLLAIVFMAYATDRSGTGPEPSNPLLGVISLLVLVDLGIEIIALVFGVVAVRQAGRKKLFGWLGLALSGSVLAFAAGVVVCGLLA